VPAHLSALTCARGSSFSSTACRRVWGHIGNHHSLKLRARQCPTLQRAPILGRNSPAPRTSEWCSLRRGHASSSHEDGMPVTGRRGDRARSVAFNARSRAASDGSPVAVDVVTLHRPRCANRRHKASWPRISCVAGAWARAPTVDSRDTPGASFAAIDTVLPQTWPLVDTSPSRPCRDHYTRISNGLSALSKGRSGALAAPASEGA
jgi:hypothetical protein